MNKAESKYFNTARLMNQALLILLETKDLEYITIKEVCQKAGVNRSTFYLHYENINDLLAETIEMIDHQFRSSFIHSNLPKKLLTSSPEENILITPEHLIEYLSFLKKHKRLLKTIHSRPLVFKNDSAYNKMCNELFYPILTKFNVAQENKKYILNYYVKGVFGIINQWLDDDCKDDIEKIVNIIMSCVGISNK